MASSVTLLDMKTQKKASAKGAAKEAATTNDLKPKKNPKGGAGEYGVASVFNATSPRRP